MSLRAESRLRGFLLGCSSPPYITLDPKWIQRSRIMNLDMAKNRLAFGTAATPTLQDWEEAVRNDPANYDLRIYFSHLLASLGLFEPAIEQCRICLEMQVGGSALLTSRRLRLVVMLVRLERARKKEHDLSAMAC